VVSSIAGDGGGRGGGDAGHNLKRNCGSGEGGDLFGGAAEVEWIAALEADDAAVRLGVFDHQLVDLVLGDDFCATALAYVMNFGGGSGELKDGLGDKVIVQKDVGGLNQAQSFYGEQVGVAGAGADQRDGSAPGVRNASELARGAGLGFADRELGKLVEQELARFGAGMGGKYLAAQAAEIFKPRA
jgi:hypothetical protein